VISSILLPVQSFLLFTIYLLILNSFKIWDVAIVERPKTASRLAVSRMGVVVQEVVTG